MPEQRILIFEPFCLDVGNERLWRGPEALHLTHKAFAVLRVVYLSLAAKYYRLTRRLSQGQKVLDRRALLASQQPSEPW